MLESSRFFFIKGKVSYIKKRVADTTCRSQEIWDTFRFADPVTCSREKSDNKEVYIFSIVTSQKKTNVVVLTP